MERVKRYSTQLSKGTGMINETLSLLEIFDEHTTKESFLRYVLETNYLSTSTEKRATDIVNVVFYQRFMKDNPSVPLWLKAARGKGLMLSSFSQLLMLYCARQHAVFYDFINTTLNPVKIDDLSPIFFISISIFCFYSRFIRLLFIHRSYRFEICPKYFSVG